MRRSRVLQLIRHHLGEASGDLRSHVDPLPQEPVELEHKVARIEAPQPPQDAVVAGVHLRELDLTGGPLPLRLRRRIPSPSLGPVAEAARRDGLGLQGVHPAEQPRQEAGRVAADLVPSERQLVQPVEEDGETVRGANRVEERIQARLERILAKQPLGRVLVGRRPDLLVGRLDQGRRAVPEAGRRRAGPAQDQHPVRRRAVRGQAGQPLGERLAPTRPGRAQDQERPAFVFGHAPLLSGQLWRTGGRASLHPA